jgi:chromosome segregation ATPase
LLYSEEDKFRD